MATAGHCVKCGIYRDSLHCDHIIPKVLGGSGESANIQHLCANCHQDKTREDQSAVTKALWQNPAFQAKQRAALTTPDYRAKVSAIRKAQWQDPKFRAKMSAKHKALWQDPVYRAKHTEILNAVRHKQFQDPLVREEWWVNKQAAKGKSPWTDPIYSAAWLAAFRDGERDYEWWHVRYQAEQKSEVA